jgi:hypothetical protein
MSRTARCKATVANLRQHTGTDSVSFALVGVAKCNGGPNEVEENRVFGEYTPHFRLDCTITNPAVASQIIAAGEGAEFYVDLIPVEKPAAE